MWPLKKKTPVELTLKLNCIAKSVLKDLKELDWEEWKFSIKDMGGCCVNVYEISHPKVGYVIIAHPNPFNNYDKQLSIEGFRIDLLNQFEKNLIWVEVFAIQKKQTDASAKKQIELENIELAKIFPQCFK